VQFSGGTLTFHMMPYHRPLQLRVRRRATQHDLQRL